MSARRTHAIDALRRLLAEAGCDALPRVNDECDYLAEHLTASQLYSVLRLLDDCLLLTHNVRHLPWAQALTCIKENIKETP